MRSTETGEEGLSAPFAGEGPTRSLDHGDCHRIWCCCNSLRHLELPHTLLGEGNNFAARLCQPFSFCEPASADTMPGLEEMAPQKVRTKQGRKKVSELIRRIGFGLLAFLAMSAFSNAAEAQPDCVSWSKWGKDRIDCASVGKDGALWHNSMTNGTWYGWNTLGGAVASDPSCVVWGSNRVDCFVKGPANSLWRRAWNGTAWQDWEDLGGAVQGRPSCVVGKGHMDPAQNQYGCFVKGPGNALLFRGWNGSNWIKWVSLAGNLESDPECVSMEAGRYDCFARGTGNVMMHIAVGAGIPTWVSHGGALQGKPECLSRKPGTLDCFVKGPLDALWHKGWTGSAWTEWNNLGGKIDGAPSCASWSNDRIDCFVRGPLNRLYQQTWNGSSWSGPIWKDLGGLVHSSPECVSRGAGLIDCLAVGPLGKMYQKTHDGMSWKEWASTGGQFKE